MNEWVWAMVEWYWQGKTEVLGEKQYTAWVVDEWMSVEQWWNDTDRGKLKYWEKKHYTAWVVDEGMSMEQWWNDTDRGKLECWEKNIIQRGWYGLMVEWYWQGKTEVLWKKHYTVWVLYEWMSMVQLWNDTDRKKLKYWEKNLSHGHFFRHKSHTYRSGFEPAPPRWEADHSAVSRHWNVLNNI